MASETCVETAAPRLLALGLLAVLLLLALAGCKNAAANTAAVHPVGVYMLVSIDGKNVPCKLTHEGTAMVVKSGSLTFSADGSCRSLSIFSVPRHPDIHRVVSADCTQNGTEVVMRWHGAGSTAGRIFGETFTMSNEGMIFSYRKQ